MRPSAAGLQKEPTIDTKGVAFVVTTLDNSKRNGIVREFGTTNLRGDSAVGTASLFEHIYRLSRCTVKGILLILVATSPRSFCQGDNQSGGRDTADQLVGEAVNLEKGQQYPEARATLLKAEEINPNNDKTRKAFEQLQKAIDQKVDELLKEASTAFASHDDEGTWAKLNQAEEIGGARDLIYYDLGLLAYRQKDYHAAAGYFAKCLDVMPDGKRRAEVEALYAISVTGEDAVGFSKPVYSRVIAFNNQVAQREPYSRKAAQNREHQLCNELESLQEELPSSPALYFDLAKCSEMELGQYDSFEGQQRPNDGSEQREAELLKRYISLAPRALDEGDVRVRLDSLSTLDQVKGSAGDQVRMRYANAARALEVQRLDLAMSEYRTADKLNPGLPETQWRLSQLYESCGDVSRTKEMLNNLRENRSSSDEQREDAQAIVDSIDSRRARYDKIVEEGRASVADLRTQAENLSLPLKANRLSAIAERLVPAVSLFRNGWEVNELLAYVHEQTGNQRLALRSLDVMWANSRPVFFDANVRVMIPKIKQHPGNSAVPSRVEVMPGSFKVSALGAEEISREDVKGVKTTRGGEVRIALQDGRIILMTMNNLNLLVPGSPSTAYLGDLLGFGHLGQISDFRSTHGIMPIPLRRALANRGTLIFKRYLGIEDAKFGSERFTLAEKGAVTGWLAMNVFMVYSAFNGSTNAFTAIDNIYEYSGGFSNSIASAISFVRLVHYQQPISASSPFRAIPVESETDSLRTSWR